jgi:hypothetical protein
VSIEDVQEKPEPPFDISFELRSGRNRIQVLGEIKQTFSPRIVAEIAPWIRRLKSLRPDLAVALLAPALSDQAQAFCTDNRIDFVDLAGNISINVPGKFTLRRTGMRARRPARSQSLHKAAMYFPDATPASCAFSWKTPSSGRKPRSGGNWKQSASDFLLHSQLLPKSIFALALGLSPRPSPALRSNFGYGDAAWPS